MIAAIAKTIEARDPYTAGHQQRVAQLSTAIARKLGLSERQTEGIHLASVIHDIGKIGIPAEILSKPSKLSRIELALIQEHAEAGYLILKDINFPWPIAQIVRQHHERFDGSGYPQGLKGDDILIEARILAVADTIDAMISHRPYRPGLGVEMALQEILRNKARLYDPVVVDACITLFRREKFKFSIVGDSC
ncbi:MAG: HD-GYP domain-containing protein [Bryobacteraceae bacterium]|jgi:putative nucleotidyltransferase with HDIG domain